MASPRPSRQDELFVCHILFLYSIFSKKILLTQQPDSNLVLLDELKRLPLNQMIGKILCRPICKRFFSDQVSYSIWFFFSIFSKVRHAASCNSITNNRVQRILLYMARFESSFKSSHPKKRLQYMWCCVTVNLRRRIRALFSRRKCYQRLSQSFQHV